MSDDDSEAADTREDAPEADNDAESGADGGGGQLSGSALAVGWASVSVAGPVFYLFGRVAADAYFGRLGVTPEEVGISYGSLVLPAGVAAVLMAGAVVVAAIVGRFVAAGAGVFLFWLTQWLVFDSDWNLMTLRNYGIGLTLIAVFYVIGQVVARGADRPAASLSLLAVATVVGMLSWVWFTSVRAAEEALNGQPSSVALGPIQISGVSARLVSIEGSEGLPPEVGGCALYLGSSEGTSVLLIERVVWRVPADVVSTTGGTCGAAGVLPRTRDLPAGWRVTSGRIRSTLDPGSTTDICGTPNEQPISLVSTWAVDATGHTAASFRVSEADETVDGATLEVVKDQLIACRDGAEHVDANGATFRFRDRERLDVDALGLGPAADKVNDLVVWTQKVELQPPGADPIRYDQAVVHLVDDRVVVTIFVDGMRNDAVISGLAGLMAGRMSDTLD